MNSAGTLLASQITLPSSTCRQRSTKQKKQLQLEADGEESKLARESAILTQPL